MDNSTYITVNENDHKYTDIEVYVSYNKGGMNYFTYKEEPRGYYLTALPVQRDAHTKMYGAFTGYTRFIKAAKRYSEKQWRALDNGKMDLAKDMIEKLLTENDLTVKEA